MIRRVRTPKREQFLYPGEELRPSQQPKLWLHGATKHTIETGRLRLAVTAGLFGLAFASIGVRLVDLMLFKDSMSAPMARTAPGVPHGGIGRADIVDRNGVIIATNLPTVNAYADCAKIGDPKQVTDKLIGVLPDLRYDDTLKRLSSGQRFIYIRRNLTPVEQMTVNRLGIPGIYFEDSERRVYPQGNLFAHVLGTTDPDNRGAAGVEKTFDQSLSDSHTPLQLSLDARVQYAAHETLAEGVSRFHADAGSAVVMDVHTGEILAMVSLPDFDPKAMGDAPADAQFNRATLGLYEMGSTFKLFTAALALENGSSTLASRYDASEPIHIGRFTISDYHGEKRWLSVPEILIHSSNIGAAKMALDAGTEVQKTYLRKFGLLSPLSLELPEVGTPQYPAVWRDINTITIAYGHGISVTPVHVVSAVSALVNGGVLIPPTVIKRDPANIPAGQQVISARTSEEIRALMRLVVLYGSGKQADVGGYDVGGKTGSAEKVAYRGGYSEHSLRTSFVAAFPVDAPRYVIVVVLDEPHGTKETWNFATAGWNAAPTAGTIVAKVAPMLGVFPLNHPDNFEPLASLVSSGAFAGPNDYARITKAVATVPAMMMDEIQTPIITTEPVAANATPGPASRKGDSIAALIDTRTPAAGDTGETQ
ncbi:MAG: penicillin-binding protein 2 [Rhodospirillaceae bacterium]|nr:MAG: penicillin-binding protein 2 [Rhodospirillaceae bacterium]